MTALAPSILTVSSAARASTRSERLRPLVERISARIAASCDEIAIFPSAEAALDAAARAFVRGRRTAIVRPAGDAFAARCTVEAASLVDVSAELGDLSTIAAAARDAQTVALSSPIRGGNGCLLPATLAPRELLQLRSRAPRPLIVLDLLDEEFARTPLTQPALLLPGTVLIRGFGDAWLRAGAGAIAPLAFIAGPRELIAPLANAPLAADAADESALIRTACADLDLPGIDRAVRRVAEGG